MDGTRTGAIGGIAMARQVHLDGGTVTQVAFSESAFPQLHIRNPERWWPYGLGPQRLQQLHVEFQTGGQVSDQQDARFGIREFRSELDANRHRLFRVNGKPILIRGGGWTHDMMLRVDPEREGYEICYVGDMHLNTLRLEGKMLDEHFFDLANRYGILVMPGLHNHASVFVFLYGSDVAPDPPAERVYLNVFAQEHWPHLISPRPPTAQRWATASPA